MSVQLHQQDTGDGSPDTHASPLIEPMPTGLSGAVVFWRYILPATAGVQDIQDAIEHYAVVSARPPSA